MTDVNATKSITYTGPNVVEAINGEVVVSMLGTRYALPPEAARTLAKWLVDCAERTCMTTVMRKVGADE